MKKSNRYQKSVVQNKILYLKRVLLTVIMLLSPVLFSQDKKEELFSKRDKILKEIEYASKLLDETSEKKGKNVEKIQLLDKKIVRRSELIKLYENQIEELNHKIADRESTIYLLEKELEIQKESYAEFILYSQKNYDNYTNGLMILASKDLNQFYLRKKYIEQLNEARKKKILIIKKLKSKIKREIENLIADKNQKEKSLSALQKEQGLLAKEKLNREKQIKSLTGEEKRLREAIEENKKIEKEIAKKIEEIIKEEAKKGSKMKLTPEQMLISKDFEGNKGRLPWPTKQGIITEHFGENLHPVIKGLVVNNSGIDISTGNAEIARVIFDGEVSKIFAIKGANYTVIVKHGAYYSVYHNLIDVKVSVGDKLKTKDAIGKVSKSKSGDTSLIHFELWKGMEKLNPELWISK